ncbi:MAG: hypothetical protein DRN78_06640, partial [Thermoproteota archaeon]
PHGPCEGYLYQFFTWDGWVITLAVVQVDFHVILEVNKEKRIGCGICVDVCPSNI